MSTDQNTIQSMLDKMGNGQSIGVVPAFRTFAQFQMIINEMDDPVRRKILSDFRQVNEEICIQQAVSKQLEEDLALDAINHHMDGTLNSPLWQKLPTEIRQSIFSYVVTADQSVHVFRPKRSDCNGFRLSLCEEASYDFEMGHCRCDDNPARNRVHSDFFDNAVFLVSQTMRREALDAFFITNSFTFTSLDELVRFASMFKRSSSKIQRLRILERVDDFPSDLVVDGIQKTRLRLKSLQHLDLRVSLSTWSAYQSLYEDGLVHQLLHFALGPPPVTQKMKRKASCLDDEPDSNDKILNFLSLKNKKILTKSATSTTLEATSPSNETSQQSSTSNTVAVPRTQLHRPKSFGDIVSMFPMYPPTVTTPLFGRAKHPDDDVTLSKPSPSIPTSANTSSSTPPPFPIPPLRSFNVQVTSRTHLRPLAPAEGNAAYYEALCVKLKHHLEDIFVDAGQKYRTVEDVPSLGPKPKRRQHDEPAQFTGAEKRGLLILKD